MNEKIIGLILSAGFSSRMGKFKPLLEYDGKSFVRNVAEKTSAVCDKIVVVTGFKSELIIERLKEQTKKNVLDKIQFVFNDEFEKGMFVSLKKGIEACGEARWVLYHFVDQPSLPEEFYFSFVKEIDERFDAIQPVYKGKKGHPIILGRKAIELINRAEENSNLKELFARNELSIKLWECGFPEALKDFDLPEDFEKTI